jgi:uncharacterized protein
MSELQEIPLFPLQLVLFPGGKIDLQIFERRYIDLIRQCMRSGTGFGVCLLKTGMETIEVGTQQTIHSTGTYAEIIDWDQLPNGLLGITVEGRTKFTIEDCWQTDSGVLTANVCFSEHDNVGKQSIPIDDDFAALSQLLQNLESHPLVEQKNLSIDYDNLWDLGWRLAELIPVENAKKQDLLEMDDPWERIENIERLVADLANDS